MSEHVEKITFFKRNPEWYYYDENDYPHLTEKASPGSRWVIWILEEDVWTAAKGRYNILLMAAAKEGSLDKRFESILFSTSKAKCSNQNSKLLQVGVDGINDKQVAVH